ncbi:HprK-related kinase A [Aquisalimonas sp.]|uniref:HprK-related kinase A n=1 Tax=unclassified Aquisalimonas TaxID=2644645 RepID=UPI0025BC6EAE|nr:HprK-related kinase A [Aquisalimonas sp.]
MRLAEIPEAQLRHRLAGPEGVTLVTGPFSTRIRSPVASVARGLADLYGDVRVEPDADWADFHVQVRAPRTPRRWFRPQVLFLSEGRSVFKPLAFHQAFPMLEWGLNWCVTANVKHHLLFHAAVVAREDRALILPAPPGSGKSTLCAGLVASGWRLLSDELAIVDVEAGTLTGLARPVSLKNASIEVIRSFAPDAFVSDPCHDTLKGTVAHLRPPRASVDRALAPVRPAWVVFPRFEPGAETRLTPRVRTSAFMELARNAFNYTVLGRLGFRRTADLIERSVCYDFTYSRLDEAVATFNAMEPPSA